MAEPELYDWPKIIADIKAGYLAREGHRLSQYKLALMLSTRERVHNETVTAIERGSQPKHWVGQKLLVLAQEQSYGKPYIPPTRDP